MSNNLVNGFSDIIAAPNLATNSTFRINQRNNFQTSTAVNVNDFVCDAWKVTTQGFDYVEVLNHVNNQGGLVFIGNGKKGQQLIIRNSDLVPFGYSFGYSNNTNPITALTSAVNIRTSNGNGIPIKVSTFPRSHALTTIYDGSVIVKRYNTTKTSVNVINTYTNYFNTNANITITLQADGNFDFLLTNFREFAGAFRNPPFFAPVPYADDLARVERYYQLGEASGASYVPFRTKMSGTPTITLSSGSPSSITTNGFVTSGTGVHTWTASV